MIAVFGLGVLAAGSGLSWWVGRCVGQRNPGGQLFAIVAAGLLPSALVVAALVAGHIMWLSGEGTPGHAMYSPLIFLLVGFPWFLVGLVANVAAAAWGTRRA